MQKRSSTNQRKPRIIRAVLLLLAVLLLSALVLPAFAEEEASLITTVDEFTAAVADAEDGDVLLVGDIEFRKMPAGLVQVPKNLTIRSGKGTNAVFTNASFFLSGTTAGAAPLSVCFENVNFRGDHYEKDDAPSVDATLPGMMNTMCAGVFKMNLNVTYRDCRFEGYHYAYGGVLNAIYDSNDNYSKCNLTLERCTFADNAGKFGGCVYLYSVNRNVTLKADSCVFERNTASVGGAVFAENAEVLLKECSFLNNTYSDHGVETNHGGAIYASNTSIMLDGCVVADNVSGGSGGGIYCRITPFFTLNMFNCTVTGNRAQKDGGLSVEAAETNLDTVPRARISFSSLIGNESTEGENYTSGQNTDFFGCLLSGVTEEEPTEENRYCLFAGAGLESDYPRAANGHILLPAGSHPVPREKLTAVAGGKAASGLGTFRVGDNYAESAEVRIRRTPRSAGIVTVLYGEPFSPETPERKGYAFEGWRYADGGAFEPGTVFLGGDLKETEVRAEWKWQLWENAPVIAIASVLLLAAVAAVLILLGKRRAASEAEPLPVGEAGQEKVLPEDWIDRVMAREDVVQTVSRREAEVLRKLLEGKSRKQIAQELFVTESAIRKHSTNIYSKFGVHNRTELLYKLTT